MNHTTELLGVGEYDPTLEFLRIHTHVAVLKSSNFQLIALTGPAGDERSLADAALFAAAPQLLEALTECSEWIREHTGIADGTLEMLTKAHKAIEKANGRAQ